MHRLQTIDTGLFHFINRSLSNPLFDRLMPVLSGEGVMQWAPDHEHVVANWDYSVEND